MTRHKQVRIAAEFADVDKNNKNCKASLPPPPSKVTMQRIFRTPTATKLFGLDDQDEDDDEDGEDDDGNDDDEDGEDEEGLDSHVPKS